MLSRDLWKILLAASLAAACLDGGSSRPGEESCATDADCDGLSCQYGRCRPACTFDRDCPDGGACVPSERGDGWVCTSSDEGSDDGEPCPGILELAPDGLCRQPCTRHEQCGGLGRMCVGGYCVDLLEECSDGEDNDGDGWTDVADPYCWGYGTEEPAVASSECNDGEDNDGDGLVDADDADCVAATDGTEGPLDATCEDGVDNDGDGWTDLLDWECLTGLPEIMGIPEDPATAFACNDGLDNDGNGLADAEDPHCAHAFGDGENVAETDPTGSCSNGADDNFDGWVDWQDADCAIFGDELSPGINWPIECDDWVDNDGDGLVDVGDPDCESGLDPYEAA